MKISDVFVTLLCVFGLIRMSEGLTLKLENQFPIGEAVTDPYYLFSPPLLVTGNRILFGAPQNATKRGLLQYYSITKDGAQALPISFNCENETSVMMYSNGIVANHLYVDCTYNGKAPPVANTIQLLDLETLKVVNEFEIPTTDNNVYFQASCHILAQPANNAFLCYQSLLGYIYVLDATTGKLRNTIPMDYFQFIKFLVDASDVYRAGSTYSNVVIDKYTKDELKWRITWVSKTNAQPQVSALVDAGPSIVCSVQSFVGSGGGNPQLVSFSKVDGKVNWVVDLGPIYSEPLYSPVVVGSNVYANCQASFICVYDIKDGSLTGNITFAGRNHPTALVTGVSSNKAIAMLQFYNDQGVALVDLSTGALSSVIKGPRCGYPQFALPLESDTFAFFTGCGGQPGPIQVSMFSFSAE